MSALVFGKDVGLRPYATDRYGRNCRNGLSRGRDVGLELIDLCDAGFSRLRRL
jgi:hypothetical protein